MALDLRKFFQATNPDRALFASNGKEDQHYYIDFSSVRGGHVIDELRNYITVLSPDEPTCQLFTGHIGCGKSTELLQLKAALEGEGFQVVYFESDRDLEMSDVDVGDIFLTIARRVSESLESIGIRIKPGYFQNLFTEIKDILQTSVELSEVEFSVGIATITAQTQSSPKLRDKLRGYLEPRTNGIIDAINQEVLEPAIKKLKQQGKNGLVVIVDNLDRVDNAPKSWGRPQQEYLFVDRGVQLRSLNCHVVYTMPLALRFSNEFGPLTQRFKDPKVLPMVQVQLRDGSECSEGMAKLRQLVLARAFPELDQEQRLKNITKVFDSPETLDHLCRVSGGHVRNLLRLLNNSIQKQMALPISRNSLEEAIGDYRNERVLAIDPDEWTLLRRVAQEKKVVGDQGYQTLIRSLFVYEYRDRKGSWFDINPILAEAEEFKK